MTNTELKTQIDTQITNETVKSGITPTDVGTNIKAVVDYADQQDALKVDKVTGERLINASEITKLSNTSGTNTGDQDLSGKQNVLVSGTNIKTINGTSVLGSGDITVGGSATKTAGSVEANNVSPYPELIYDLNTVNTTGSSDKVVLPTTTEIGKEVLVFALNNASSFTVRGNQAGTSVLSAGGVSTTVGSISIGANISARFIHLGSGYWKAEII